MYVPEPIAASTVELIVTGGATCYETYVGATVGEVMAQGSVYPEALRNGHEVRFCNHLELLLEFSARTWVRDHARVFVRASHTSAGHRRILKLGYEVKDSSNIKQVVEFGRMLTDYHIQEESTRPGGVQMEVKTSTGKPEASGGCVHDVRDSNNIKQEVKAGMQMEVEVLTGKPIMLDATASDAMA